MIARRFAPVLAGLAAALLSACGDGAGAALAPEAPQPGVLTVTLTTPFPDDRAMLITVSGPDEATAVVDGGSGYSVHARPGGTSFRAAVFGRLSSGPLVRFTVPDVGRASAYKATIQEVVDPASSVRPSTSGYGLAITR